MKFNKYDQTPITNFSVAQMISREYMYAVSIHPAILSYQRIFSFI